MVVEVAIMCGGVVVVLGMGRVSTGVGDTGDSDKTDWDGGLARGRQ